MGFGRREGAKGKSGEPTQINLGVIETGMRSAEFIPLQRREVSPRGRSREPPVSEG